MYKEQDERAKELGAVTFYDEMVSRKVWTMRGSEERYIHFARYYFNKEGEELAYFIPDMLGIHESDDVHHDAKLGLHIHPTPRTWGLWKGEQKLY